MPESRRSVRFAIYTRQSVDTTADFSSCDAQFAVCSDFAKETGEPRLTWCGQRFDDQGHSGATLERPGLHRLRKVIDLGGVQRVYAVALDRLSRRLHDTIILLDELDRCGVELRLVHQPEFGQTAESRFLRHILASFAEFEREMIASRIAETRAYLKQHGRRLAGPVPFGFDADPETKQLVPNPREARRVRAMFKRAATGQTPDEIARRISHLGWRTKQWVSRRSDKMIGVFVGPRGACSLSCGTRSMSVSSRTRTRRGRAAIPQSSHQSCSRASRNCSTSGGGRSRQLHGTIIASLCAARSCAPGAAGRWRRTWSTVGCPRFPP